MYEDEFNNEAKYSDDVLEQIFIELFREYESQLYTFLFKMVKSDAQAKDILQDVFLKLWTIRSRIPEISNISAFLYQIAENRVIDYLRSAASDQKRKAELWKRLDDINTSNPENYLQDKEYHAIIQLAIEHLSPQRKSVYLLSKSEGLQRNKIAAIMEVSPHTVRNQLAKAMEQIASYVKKHSK
ncbi:RNA polymerase sigma factor [Niabella aquatica]